MYRELSRSWMLRVKGKAMSGKRWAGVIGRLHTAEGPIRLVKRHKLHPAVVNEPCFLELLRGRIWGPSPST